MNDPDFHDIFGEPEPDDEDRKTTIELKTMIELESQNPKGWRNNCYKHMFSPIIERNPEYNEKADEVLNLLDGVELQHVFCIGIEIVEVAISEMVKESKPYVYIYFSAILHWLTQSFKSHVELEWSKAFSELIMENDDTFKN